MKILAIESSCDETAAAVIEDGRKILSSVVDTQIATHALYGGVVPCTCTAVKVKYNLIFCRSDIFPCL